MVVAEMNTHYRVPFEDSSSCWLSHPWLKDGWNKKPVTWYRLGLELWELREHAPQKWQRTSHIFLPFMTLLKREFLRRTVRERWRKITMLSKEHRNWVRHAWITFPTVIYKEILQSQLLLLSFNFLIYNMDITLFFSIVVGFKIKNKVPR